MVGGTGSVSNPKNRLIAEWNGNNKGVASQLETALDPEVSEQLFDVLADWNEYLEQHVPYFQEPSL